MQAKNSPCASVSPCPSYGTMRGSHHSSSLVSDKPIKGAASTLFDQYLENVGRGPEFDDGTGIPALPDPLPARVIAFYLPQFHAIPENDEWWGEGFTEWTNVAKALPQFEGHYQPRMPGNLGFYDLTNPEILQRQAKLARRYGISGFCFHHYWFAGRRLLERPLKMLLADRSIDLPFCINWANENWTRRWAGFDREVLIAQDYSAEDDLAFAESLRPLFDDPRYIRVAGRPLLSIYRPSLLPDAKATVARWREHFAENGEEPMIVMVQGLEFDPRPVDLDGAIGFPPWGAPSVDQFAIPEPFHPAARSYLVDYANQASASIGYWPEGFRYFPGVCPGWDNSARRGLNSAIVTGSTPGEYRRWLAAAVRQVVTNNSADNRLVFINAWNEWAEGAYLEPDRHYGHAYLAATARALNDAVEDPTGTRDTVQRSGQPGSLPAWRRFARKVTRRAAVGAHALARALASI